MIKLVCLILLAGSVISDPQPAVFSSKIVGGNYVKKKEIFPYQVSLMHNKIMLLFFKERTHFCGGTLISVKYVLTAAHCVEKKRLQEIEVQAGNYFLNGENGQFSIVKKISIHPQYIKYIYDNDAALLELETPIVLNENVQPIELSTSTPKENSKGIIIGWGKVAENAFMLSETLKYAVVQIRNHDECKRLYELDVITDRMICAGYLVGGVGTCSGDSGGPFVVNNTLAGITSWSHGCGQPNSSSVFTDVSKIVDWINSVLDNTPLSTNV